MRFVIVEMRPIPMDVFPEAVAGTVEDAIAVTRLLEHLSRRAVDFPAPQIPSARRGAFHQPNRRIAGPDDRAEGLRWFFRHPGCGEPHPGDISKDRTLIGRL